MSGSESDRPAATGSEPGEDYVEFLRVVLDGAQFAVELGRVAQVLRRVEVTRVPRTPPAIRGATEVDGDVAAVIDPLAVIGLDGGEGSGDDGHGSGDDDAPRTFVQFYREGDGDAAGMLVETADTFETVHVSRIVPPAEADGDPPGGPDWYLAAVVGEEPGEPPVYVLDVPRLLQGAAAR